MTFKILSLEIAAILFLPRQFKSPSDLLKLIHREGTQINLVRSSAHLSRMISLLINSRSLCKTWGGIKGLDHVFRFLNKDTSNPTHLSSSVKGCLRLVTLFFGEFSQGTSEPSNNDVWKLE